MNLLHFSPGGYWLYCRLLEAGTFETLKPTHDSACRLQLDAMELAKLDEQSQQLVAQANEVAKRDDVIQQLEAKIQRLEKDYLKLWQERFAAKSERYLDKPNQLRLDFVGTRTRQPMRPRGWRKPLKKPT